VSANPEPDVPASSFVAARARRATGWLGEEVLQRPVPLATDLPRRPAPAARERLP
jgi:hypothetical protein